MAPIRSVAVFLGSSSLPPPPFHELARATGLALAQSGFAVVYGGASVGLMGELAEAALGAGGEVIGVIPRHLVDREIAHGGLTEQVLCETMHERKAIWRRGATQSPCCLAVLAPSTSRRGDHLGDALPPR